MPYMSPEQMVCSADNGTRSDLWSIGITLYELLAGRLPFQARTEVQLCVATLHQAPTPLGSVLPDVPEALEHIVHACLENAQEKTPASVRELASAPGLRSPDEGSNAR